MSISTLSVWRNRWQQLRDDRRGATAVVSGLVFTGFVGFVGLGTETGMWYYTHRAMQATVDSAALSASQALEATPIANYVSEAKSTAAQYGFVDGQNGVTVTVNRPPLSGNYVGNAAAVEVIVQQPQTALISAAFLPGGTGPTITARAVALQGNPGTGCILALDTKASASAFNNGTTAVNLVNCSLYVNSNSSSALDIVGSASITAYSAYVVGNLSDSGNATITTTNGVHTGVNPVADPYANVSLPTFQGCDHNNFSVSKNGATLTPGVYCGGIKVDAGGTATFTPGTYIVDGGSVSVAGNATVNQTSSTAGDGVTVVLTNSSGGTPATVAIHGGANIDMTAPNSGPLANMAFIQDRNGTVGTNNDFSGGTTQKISGVIYFPKESVSFAGGTDTNGCTHIVADEIDFKGNATVAISCPGRNMGTIGASSSKLVE